MNDDYKVLITYRSSEAPYAPSEMETVAADETIRWVDDGLRGVGFETEVWRVGDDVEDMLLGYDPCETVIFNYCDGYHEDESGYDPITKIYERLGFAFTGADDYTLYFAQNKVVTKSLFDKNKISTPPYRVCYYPDDAIGWDTFPAIVKPTRLHASIGITEKSVVETPDELVQQVQWLIKEFKQPALVEEYIEGTEYRVSLWGNGKLRVLPLMAYVYLPVPGRRYGITDYETKWSEETIEFIIDPDLEPKVQARIEKAARATFRAVGMRDYGAMDIRVRDGRPYVLDANQNPDICELSTFYTSALALGFEYGDIMARIVRLAAERRPERQLQTVMSVAAANKNSSGSLGTR
jgi:D-alanine-D-alanine ligase